MKGCKVQDNTLKGLVLFLAEHTALDWSDVLMFGTCALIRNIVKIIPANCRCYKETSTHSENLFSEMAGLIKTKFYMRSSGKEGMKIFLA